MPHRICRHIRPSGRRCQTPAVRDQALCYYHLCFVQKHNGDVPQYLHLMNTLPPEHVKELAPDRALKNPLMSQYYGLRPTGPDDLDLPPLEDADSIQIGLSTVLNALAQNRIETKRASILLYGLQLALATLRTPRFSGPATSPELDTVLGENGELISPELTPLCTLDDPPSLASPAATFELSAKTELPTKTLAPAHSAS